MNTEWSLEIPACRVFDGMAFLESASSIAPYAVYSIETDLFLGYADYDCVLRYDRNGYMLPDAPPRVPMDIKITIMER